MSKYEKHTWAIGILILLSAVLFCILPQRVVFDFSPVLMLLLMAVFQIINGIWPHPWKDHTETEIQFSHAATAWTLYGVAIIVWGLIAILTPMEPFLVSRDAVVMALVRVFFIFCGVRFILLACMLRKERLSKRVNPQLFSDELLPGEETPWKRTEQ